MTRKHLEGSRLFYGDNLATLREYVADESVDLVYLDPRSIPSAPTTTCLSMRAVFR